MEFQPEITMSRQQWLHRPVTPRELNGATAPMPISITDFGSIFPRDSFPQASCLEGATLLIASGKPL